MQKPDFKKFLDHAAIPRLCFQDKLTNHGKPGKQLRAYVEAERTKRGHDGKRGVWLFGDVNEHSPLIKQTFGKELVLTGEKLLYVPVQRLYYSLTKHWLIDESYLDRVVESQALLVPDFYDHSLSCPYTFGERKVIEEFILGEFRYSQKRFYFGGTAAIQNADWWSREFRKELATLLTEYDLD